MRSKGKPAATDESSQLAGNAVLLEQEATPAAAAGTKPAKPRAPRSKTASPRRATAEPIPHVTRLSDAVRKADSASPKGHSRTGRRTAAASTSAASTAALAAAAPTPAEAPRAVPTTADILPPVIVLVLQLGAGLLIGASPPVLGAAAAAIVLAAYVVQVTKRRRAPAASASEVASAERLRRTSVQISPSSVATFEGGPLRASAPSPEPVTPEAPAVARVQRLDGAPPSQAPSPSPSAETPSIDGQPEHHPDLEWLWGTILQDPSARPQRRNDR